MKRVIGAALALTLLASVAPTTAQAAAPSDAETRYATEFREAMGLKAGDAYVRSSFSDAERFSSSGEMADQTALKASETVGDVRLTMKLDGPLVAGQPARIRTRLTNTGSGPIWWHASSGVSVGALMPDATWRLGQTTQASLATLKGATILECEPFCDRVVLEFEPVRFDGEPIEGWGSDMRVTERIEPGGTFAFVHEWDGMARFDRDTPPVGLPPDGPLDISATTYVSRSPDGRGKPITAEVRTSIVEGRDKAQLHPFEILDAALADGEFAEFVSNANPGWGNPYLAYDQDVGVWYVGTCRLEPEATWAWRLGVVEPESGDVLGLLEGQEGDFDRACRPDSQPSSFAGVIADLDAGSSDDTAA